MVNKRKSHGESPNTPPPLKKKKGKKESTRYPGIRTVPANQLTAKPRFHSRCVKRAIGFTKRQSYIPSELRIDTHRGRTSSLVTEQNRPRNSRRSGRTHLIRTAASLPALVIARCPDEPMIQFRTSPVITMFSQSARFGSASESPSAGLGGRGAT